MNNANPISPPDIASSGLWVTITDFALISIGATINAVALQMLLIPNEVVAGGITGLAVIGLLLFELPFALFLLALNLPLLVLQWKFLGGFHSFVRTLVGVGVLALATELLKDFPFPVITDRLLVITYGGILCGVGLGLVFRGHGTTGGADILGRLCNRYLGISVGRTLLLVNIAVYGLAGVLFGPEPAMVALLLSFVMSLCLDAVLHGMTSSRVAIIITENSIPMREMLVTTMGQGLTVMNARGGRSDSPMILLYAVIPRAEVQRTKTRVLELDPNAFITWLTPREATGGFNLARPLD